MREIKFRAWDKEDKYMDYEPFKYAHDADIYGSASEVYLNEYFKSDYLIYMQYTGLKDKNGKEIYEGDILVCREMHDSNVFDSVWRGSNEKGWKPVPQVIERISPIKWKIPSDISYHPMWWEIIGNIYENGELLKEG